MTPMGCKCLKPTKARTGVATGWHESVQLEVRELESKMKSFLATIHKMVLVNAIAS